MSFASALPHRALLRGILGAVLTTVLITLSHLHAEGTPSASANFSLARKFSKENLAPFTYSTLVMPSWIGKSDRFWYAYRTSKGTQFYLVDPTKKDKRPLFDHDRLAAQLADQTRKPIEGHSLPISQGKVNDEGTIFSFVTDAIRYEYDLTTGKLTARGKAPPPPPAPGSTRRTAEDDEDEANQTDTPQQIQDGEVDRTKGPPEPPRGDRTRATSPDGKLVVFVQDHGLHLAEKGKEKEAVILAKGGGEEYTFALSSWGSGGRERGPSTDAGQPRRSTWAPDGKHFVAYREDRRGMKELFVINSLTDPRPALEKYRYSMPGEEAIQKTELHFGSAESRALRQVQPRWRDESYSVVHWGPQPGELRFIRQDRLRRNIELCAVALATGETRTLLSEGFENAPIDYQPPRYLEETREMIWWSERSGWGHFYLCDQDGKIRHSITSGPWRASRIVHLDPKERRLWFLGNGREKGENVYYQHLYSVNLDGTGLTLLDAGSANQMSYLSPSRKFVVANSSRVDRAPESVVRDGTGNKIMDLERTDLSRLEEFGWKLPETFSVKAGDGVTDLYGNLWKPFDFDPRRKYPIIAQVYPGPQQEGVTHLFAAHSSMMQLAQLGFIVVQVGHRGGAPLRSKAYASFGYFNLRDYSLVDKKSALEQLAARHAWIDLNRVGIYGHSGGGFMTAAALMQKPYNDFFKVGVASAGNHDNNIYNNYWSERYHGLREVPVPAKAQDATRAQDATKVGPAAPPPSRTRFEIKVPTNAELAANLKGRLLLIHGELDNNVHPANTLRLVDALIKANKRFDLLILPGTRHGFGSYTPYIQRRTWEYFAEHLLSDRRTGADLGD
ncbi:MAG: prolyl oligopeptidase family serine peptidase [Gemmataceae bacterium]